jgi:hypothetical protein
MLIQFVTPKLLSFSDFDPQTIISANIENQQQTPPHLRAAAAADLSTPTNNSNNQQSHTNNRANNTQLHLNTKPRTPASERILFHDHNQIIVEAAFAFEEEDCFVSLLTALVLLLPVGRSMVDEHVIINPVEEGGQIGWTHPSI